MLYYWNKICEDSVFVDKSPIWRLSSRRFSQAVFQGSGFFIDPCVVDLAWHGTAGCGKTWLGMTWHGQAQFDDPGV